MARFRNNEQLLISETIYQQAGLKIERTQCLDRVLPPELDRWRSWSFRIVLGGTRYLRYGDYDYTLAPASVVWHSPLAELVRIRSLPRTGADMLVVTFSAERWRLFAEQSPAFCLRNARLFQQPRQPLIALQPATPQLHGVLRQLLGLSQAERAVSALLRELGEFCFEGSAQPQAHERRQRVERAQARMVLNLAQPPSLQQLAADLNVSPRQLQRDFLACTGLTPIRYLNAVRLSEANNLLASTTLPIAGIAQLLGYVSLAHFSAAFRQMYGYSPRDAREPPADCSAERLTGTL